jgi:hypothetical protein
MGAGAAPNFETRGKGAADIPEGPNVTLRADQSYAAYLDNEMRNGSLAERRSTATDFDVRAYWRGMAFNDWKGASAEQRFHAGRRYR